MRTTFSYISRLSIWKGQGSRRYWQIGWVIRLVFLFLQTKLMQVITPNEWGTLVTTTEKRNQKWQWQWGSCRAGDQCSRYRYLRRFVAEAGGGKIVAKSRLSGWLAWVSKTVSAHICPSCRVFYGCFNFNFDTLFWICNWWHHPVRILVTLHIVPPLDYTWTGGQLQNMTWHQKRLV